MAYEDLLREKRIRRQPVDHDDIIAALTIAQARLGDAAVKGLSDDGRFIFAYDAVRAAAEALMGTQGYRPVAGPGHHETVFGFLHVMADGRWAREAREFDQARRKRNAIEYDEWGLVSTTEADALFESARGFLNEAIRWISAIGRDDVPVEDGPLS